MKSAGCVSPTRTRFDSICSRISVWCPTFQIKSSWVKGSGREANIDIDQGLSSAQRRREEREAECLPSLQEVSCPFPQLRGQSRYRGSLFELRDEVVFDVGRDVLVPVGRFVGLSAERWDDDFIFGVGGFQGVDRAVERSPRREVSFDQRG
jgi:hypothetical protein